MLATTHYNPALNEALAVIHNRCDTADEFERKVYQVRGPLFKLGIQSGTKLTIKDSSNRTRITHYRPS